MSEDRRVPRMPPQPDHSAAEAARDEAYRAGNEAHPLPLSGTVAEEAQQAQQQRYPALKLSPQRAAELGRLIPGGYGQPLGAHSDAARPPEPQAQVEPMLRWFEFDHLPEHLQEVSEPFCNLARHIVLVLPRNPERTVALRKLLEAKDCAVRSRLDMHGG